MTCLRFQGATIHRRLPESFVGEQVAIEFERVYKGTLIYRGESLAEFSNSVFKELCHPSANRKKLSEAQQERIWQRQGHCCNTCGMPAADRTNVDHISPRFQGGGDDLDNLQIICFPCHASKSMLETLSLVEEEHPLLSRFSLETCREFVESLKSPQLFANLNEIDLGAVSVSVIQCRPHALTENDCDVPGPRTTLELADYTWVGISNVDGWRSPISMLPYFGPAWYGKATVAFLVDVGIAKVSDVQLNFSASTRRPAKYLADRLN